MSLSLISRPIRLGWCFCALLLFSACRDSATGTIETPPELVPIVQPDAPVTPPRDASEDFFDNGVIPQLRIELKESPAKKLREDARHYVKCKLIENGETTYADVAIKLKGAAGSFRELDDKPAFTLNMNKYVKGQTFHAVDKFHLNNSVQDESYLCEWLCSDLCRDAKVPTPRATHARVWLNDRDLGLYVLKEGFDDTFLKRHFADGTGNLYDGGFVQDIDADLEKDCGKGSDDHSDLQSLKAACLEPDPEQRWPAIEKRLDVDAFVSFMAIELMTCHWDGYTQNKNNYRIYFDPANGNARFLPHGMDQMFGDPGFSILDYQEPIVANAVMHNPKWRKRYRARVAELLPLFEPQRLNEKLDTVLARLQPVVNQFGEEFANAHADRVRELKERIAAREPNLREQLQNGDPTPQEFNADGIAEIADWFPAQETDDTKIEELDIDGQKRYSIQVGDSGQCVASWRRKVLLAKGHYRLEARLRTESVEAREDESGAGAGLRISGGKRDNKLAGNSDWQAVTYEFEVLEDVRDVTLVAELRATRGRMWLDPAARLKKMVP
ncbi:MAG: CotH kinase family protein [Planctomycetaceae bacterium]|nr:CotH kinase family protein [Planctomycetaceae bacterium]